MRKAIFGTLTILVLLGAGAGWLTAAPTVSNFAASPTVIAVNTPSQVLFTAKIDDPSIIPTGVNLLRIVTNGTQTIVAVMHDDGLNGDTVAGDKIFSASLALNEVNTGAIQFQVSAAFKGLLRRVSSNGLSIQVWTGLADPTTGLNLKVPPLAQPTRVLDEASDSGQVIEVEVYQASTNTYVSVASAILYPNPNRETLTTWFTNNVDSSGLLLNTGVYAARDFTTGVKSLTRVGPLPDSFLQSNGPIEDVFATVPNGIVVVGLIQAQDTKLGDFGYSRQDVQQFLESIAENLAQ